jgi:hypothetical protein
MAIGLSVCSPLWPQPEHMRRMESKVKSPTPSASEQHHVLSDKLLQGACGLAGHGFNRIGDG